MNFVKCCNYTIELLINQLSTFCLVLQSNSLDLTLDLDSSRLQFWISFSNTSV